MMKQAATTLAPIWRNSFTAPSAMPGEQQNDRCDVTAQGNQAAVG
jgi:hypothetical protein